MNSGLGGPDNIKPLRDAPADWSPFTGPTKCPDCGMDVLRVHRRHAIFSLVELVGESALTVSMVRGLMQLYASPQYRFHKCQSVTQEIWESNGR